ncbi:MAG: sulfatase-like hydrolase/transferase [Verrucomicrobiaceae bacterium]|nr:sulfatase-like hydrolase/transferase [Verrucomicrobiaceae bacterium]
MRSFFACWVLLPGLALAAARPNFVFILVDDQSPFDLKVYNRKSTLETPNIDQLAARGMVFDSAHHMGASMGAVCTPSRHMIMSGRSVWHLPVSPWASKTSPPSLEQQTIPAVFNRAGYATMRTCKTGNSYEAANKLFTARHDASKRGGTHESGSGWHGDRVMDYLDERERSKSLAPFLIYYGFSHPHDTRDGKPELLAKYGATNHEDKLLLPSVGVLTPPLPSNYLSAHPFDTTHSDVRDEVGVSGVWGNRDEASIRNEIGREYACSENIDIQVGRVMERLQESGQLENTYVFYTADHGISIGRHGLMGKQNLYEHTWRVPFIVAGPGIKPGSRVPGNIYLMDVLATLCDLAGVEAPVTNEGLSFRSVLEGHKMVVRDVLYGVYAGGSKPGMRAVKKDGWKLIEYEAPDRKVRETQLFDLTTNPDELLPEHQAGGVTTNLAAQPEHATKLKEMKALLLDQMRKYDDPWRFSDQPNDDLQPPPNAPAGGKGKRKAKKVK